MSSVERYREVSLKNVTWVSGGKEFRWLARKFSIPANLGTVGVTHRSVYSAMVKAAHFVFDYEAQIIHDLSVFDGVRNSIIVTQSGIHAETLLRDISSNDLNICVSEATCSDLERYFPEAPRCKNIVAYPGVVLAGLVCRFLSIDLWANHEVEDFIVVSGHDRTTQEHRCRIGFYLSLSDDYEPL